jgi:hypothetical protein
MDNARIIAELTRAKAEFQLRAIVAAMGMPISASPSPEPPAAPRKPQSQPRVQSKPRPQKPHHPPAKAG